MVTTARGCEVWFFYLLIYLTVTAEEFSNFTVKMKTMCNTWNTTQQLMTKQTPSICGVSQFMYSQGTASIQMYVKINNQ